MSTTAPEPKTLLLETVPEEFELDPAHGGAVTKDRFGEPIAYSFDTASYNPLAGPGEHQRTLLNAGFEKGYVRIWFDRARTRGICAWVHEYRDESGAAAVLESMNLEPADSADLPGVRLSEPGEHCQYAWVHERWLAHIIVHGAQASAIGRSLAETQRSRLTTLLP